jgi:hypothetical protein
MTLWHGWFNITFSLQALFWLHIGLVLWRGWR